MSPDLPQRLLHRLHEPQGLWQSIAAAGAPGAAVMVMDLFRPESQAAAQAIVVNAVNQVAISATPTAAQLMARAQMGAYLILSSFHFQVQH